MEFLCNFIATAILAFLYSSEILDGILSGVCGCFIGLWAAYAKSAYIFSCDFIGVYPPKVTAVATVINVISPKKNRYFLAWADSNVRHSFN